MAIIKISELGISRQAVYALMRKGHLYAAGPGKIDDADPRNASWFAKRRKETPAPVAAVEDIDELDGTEALTRLLNASNIQSMSYADVQKVQKIESALKTRVERQQKRGELIERTIVKTLFGKIYQVDVQELRTLGSKIAPEVAGLMGIDDPSMILMVEQRIDGEILKSLAHIKHIIDEFLNSND